MTEQDTAKRRIAGAARKRREASLAKEAATDELRHYCREGRAVGLSVAEIAGLAELSRQAVYDFLNEDPEHGA